jgi:DNA invertase Pin-like site-specific DNA recombinase
MLGLLTRIKISRLTYFLLIWNYIGREILSMTNQDQNRNGGAEEKMESHPPRKAAEYVRMSTEHQQYSTENQHDAIQEYALQHNIEIMRTYSDGGKSGLSIQGRNALQQLIQDVQSGKVDFDVILVYDVSRWGRFQDADESAYYEYICKQNGIMVIYCAEQFENDGSPVSTIVKGVKRAMAGEYSRELSNKVFKGQCKLIELGYRQGGYAGFGLRRMLVDKDGKSKKHLERGEQKSIQTDRVILVHGPEKEVKIVSWIYHSFAKEGKTEKEIAEILNSQAIKTDLDRSWSIGTVRQVLTNEKYIGNNVYNRCSFKLKKKRIKNPQEMWIRKDGAFKAIVSPGLFYLVQGIMVERSRRFSDDELLEKLSLLYQAKGYVSGILIDESEEMPSSSVFRHRFGSLIRVYQLIGYTPERDYQYIEINKQLRKKHKAEVESVLQKLECLGADIIQDEKTNIIFINGEFSVSIVIARCFYTQAGSLRWRVRLEHGNRPDITIVIRMSEDNKTIEDFYLLPSIDMTIPKLTMKEENGVFLDAYRFDTLDFFFGMAERIRLQEAA